VEPADADREPGTQRAAPASADDASPTPSAVDDTSFAHASEAEMARILDFYDVRWAYEPTTFPILWNLDGDVVESFAPDFYLPELDMFLEMTTLKQRLVRKKNRKLRRLRELYPDVRIKLFYARDFRAMMLKYGRLGLAESLSGTPGQVVPERAAVEVPTEGVPVGAPIEPADAALPAVLVQEGAAARPRPVDRPTQRPGSRATTRTRTSRARRGRARPSSAGVEEAEA
jgi:hypoxanthine phosphoribosyltransferase